MTLTGVALRKTTELERVSKKSLKPNDTCPICGLAFLDGQLHPSSLAILLLSPSLLFIISPLHSHITIPSVAMY